MITVSSCANFNSSLYIFGTHTLAERRQRPPSKKGQDITVFISYAREDTDAAKKLYQDLKDSGLNPWLDKYKLLPGQNWENEIEDAIRKSKYFIPLFSSTSVKKIGHVQNEFRFALDVFKSHPPGMIFYIPVRLDECEIPYKELSVIHRADLFPIKNNYTWKEGVRQIIEAMKVQEQKQDETTAEDNAEYRSENGRKAKGKDMAPAGAHTPHIADNKTIQTNKDTPVQITLTGTGDIVKFFVGTTATTWYSNCCGTTSNNLIYTPNIRFMGQITLLTKLRIVMEQIAVLLQ